MSKRTKAIDISHARSERAPAFQLAPLAGAVAVLIGLGASQQAQAQQAFSPAWFAGKGATQGSAAATGYLPNGTPAAWLTNPTQQQQQANAQLQRSINNLSTLARGIAAQQAAQEAARQAALANGGSVPDGLADGGLKVDTNSLTRGWLNANAPTPGNAGGKATVTVQQTADRAILNWETFNVGKNTILNFQQDASWSVLNRVNDPLARPSQIQGQINAPGTVMIVNRNGIVFAGGSQVNTRNLAAAAAVITDAQFRDKGLYVDSNGSLPSFTNAAGRIEVQAGAQLATSAATSATQSGGYVLLMGSSVSNAGRIVTPGGQTTLAAGDSFYIRKGVSTDGNATSTTRGNEVSTQGSMGGGKAINTGLITATTGDITLTGHEVVQGGVVVSTTSVATRGTIHLLNRAGDASGSVTLAENSATAVVLDASSATALDSQRDAALKNLDGIKTTNNVTPNFDNLSKVADRIDLSRIEIVSGNTVEFKDASATLATGGQIAVSAAQRSLVGNGALLDVAGAVGVNVAMEANNLAINVQGNELRDAAINRDAKSLNNSNIWVDRRSLVLVPAGTNGYATDRWYTAGGLLEVSGYLATGGHSVGEWMALGGTVTFAGKDVVTQSGSSINLSGGTLNVQTGYINQSWLKGADGRLYEVSNAPGDLLYSGIYKGFEVAHARWGEKTTEYFYNPLIAPQRRLESGYTVGRDAGRLVIATESAVLEGQLTSEVYQGPRQTQAAQDNLDGYYQSQTAAARRGQLIIGQYLPRFDTSANLLRYGLTPLAGKVTLADQVAALADGLPLSTVLPADRRGSIVLDTGLLNGFRLGGLLIGARESIAVDGAVQMASGGNLTLLAQQVKVNADVTAYGGVINLGNTLLQMSGNGRYEDVTLTPLAGKPTAVQVARGVHLDTSGRWVNLLMQPDDVEGMPAINGGTVSISTTGAVSLGQGSVVDVSSGAAMLVTGKGSGGKGGNVRLRSLPTSGAASTVGLEGDIRGYGVNGGGTLSIDAGRIQIGGATPSGADVLRLDPALFGTGFSNYALSGAMGVSVADGVQLDVTMPVYRFADQAGAVAGGASVTQALALYTPPLFLENATTARMTQRKGASLSLQAGSINGDSAAASLRDVELRIGRNAGITVDPGQAITLTGIGQVTLDKGAHLSAWGGRITLGQLGLSEFDPLANAAYAGVGPRSIWIGEGAVLDVAGRAVTAIDARGQRYGSVSDGGSIVIGASLNTSTGQVSAKNLHLFVALREGAVLDASGSHAVLDVPGLGPVDVAGRGGSISLAAGDGLYLDGSMRAASGGQGAAGGSLTVALEAPSYLASTTGPKMTVRELAISQQAASSPLAYGLGAAEGTAQMSYGYAQLGVNQVQAGGFGQLSLFSRTGLRFDGDVALEMAQSLQLYSTVAGPRQLGGDAHRVTLSAPYVRLAGAGQLATPDALRVPGVNVVAVTPDRQTLTTDLTVGANLIDVRDSFRLLFARTTLDSQGDLRFLASVNPAPSGSSASTSVITAGDVILRAVQVYPDTGAVASVQAGIGGPKEPASGNSRYYPESSIKVERRGAALPAMPYSVFGSLALGAATIEQGGVLRAPLGAITLGASSAGPGGLVEFLPGSLTSVSAAGLVMPYGGTVDGISYTYNGSEVSLVGVGGSRATNNNGMLQGITLDAMAIRAQPGATLDLSGGGDLKGAGFISGRGGSTDARMAPLVQVGASGRFTLPSLTNNPVYAILPGTQAAQAPGALAGGASDPMVGQQITIGAGVAGLPAGTYTLLPSTYAMLPGAFRVELNGAAGMGAAVAAIALRNGSTAVAAQLSIANTAIGDQLFRQAIVTPGRTLRSYAQYDETGYADFILADAAKRGVPRAMAPADGKSLRLTLSTGMGADALQFDGTANFAAANGAYPGGGYAGSLVVLSKARSFGQNAIEIIAPGASATPGFDGVSLRSDSLNRFAPGRMVIGSVPVVVYGQSGSVVDFFTGDVPNIFLRSGASLSAPEVMLVTGSSNIGSHQVVIEQGASINTIGRGKAAYDADTGYIYTGGVGVVAVSNGRINFLPRAGGASAGGITIGGCTLAPCAGQTELYSEGSITMLTSGSFQLGDAVRYGTRSLTLGVSSINAGSSQALADAAARNILPVGLALNQDLLNRLLAGDTRYGAPALEALILSARDSFNFYGTTTLDTNNPQTGKSTLKDLVLNTPAIYGYGNAGDVATIQTSNLIWNGGASPAGGVIAHGAGTGSGALEIRAERIEFGYGPLTQPTSLTVFDRIALGFANVNLIASDRVTANHKGTWSIYQSQGAFDPATGFQYSGGNLNITTPMLTGEAASINRLAAGGAITVNAMGDRGAAGRTGAALGAELTLAARDVRVNGTVALPSGKLTLDAQSDVILGEQAIVDMAGRKINFNDVARYSWGGDVVLQSAAGSIRQAAGSVIDLSAQNNRAGTLNATAVNAGAGVIDLQGSIAAGASGYYDAGGTLLPYRAGSVELHAQKLGDDGANDARFAALNQRLNDGAVFGARSFQIKQGDLTIGSDLRAGEVNVSLDGGSLTVAGIIDASGERVGSIRLAAGNNLNIVAGAVLDAHGRVLRVDSYGKIIDSPNRAIVELNAGLTGTLSLAAGARIDLRHGTDAAIGAAPGQNDGVARGTLSLNAYRTGETSGDARIAAAGPLDIRGARSIDVNAMWRYDDAPDGVDPAGNGRPFQIITQGYLDAKHGQNTLFMTQALANANLMNGKLAGLRAYTEAFHFKPGMDIVSRTANGDLVVQGDLDLSGMRYASVNPYSQKTGVYGSGEAGALSLRAGGDLNIYGSINDGFVAPPVTQDDNGWLLLPGVEFTGSNIVVPRTGVVLGAGTVFQAGHTLNYDLPVQASRYAKDLLMPVPSVLSASLAVAAGTVFSANVRDSSGNLIHAAGSMLAADETLPANTRFDAGMRLPAATQLAALVWPRNVALPNSFTMNGDLTLPLGAFIPAGTDIKLAGGAASIDLRDGSSGRQGKLWAVAPMLAEGSQSWSIRLVAGADTAAADSRVTRPHLAGGNLRLADHHYGMYGKPRQDFVWTQQAVDDFASAGMTIVLGDPIDPTLFGTDSPIEACNSVPEYCAANGPLTYVPTIGNSRFSVVRTGAADMDLMAAGNVSIDTLYGVYTAGTSTTATGSNDPYNLPRARNADGTVLGPQSVFNEKFVDGGADSLARAWYPGGGGNLTLRAGGDIIGNQMIAATSFYLRPDPNDRGYDSTAPGNWLWRQGSGGVLGAGQNQATAWWINFGSYVVGFGSARGYADQMVGFTGLGTLGGGNLRVEAGGSAGTLESIIGTDIQRFNARGQALVLAVGSTGRVGADGSLTLTGGGDLDLRLGGSLNPVDPGVSGLDGAIINLRGNVQVTATNIGRMQLAYSTESSRNIPGETRAFNALVATRADTGGGITLVPGDATVNLATRGDMVINTATDAGRGIMGNETPVIVGAPDPANPGHFLPTGRGQSWFSLWTDRTAIDLLAAGGNLVPIKTLDTPSDLAVMYPGILRAAAASGSLYYGFAANLIYNPDNPVATQLLLALSANGELSFLARDSIYGGLATVSQSAASLASMATPLHPAFSGTTASGQTLSNLSVSGNPFVLDQTYPLTVFEAASVSGELRGNGQPARFYAVERDLVSVNSGRTILFNSTLDKRIGQTWYEGAQPVWMKAGRDIVSSGSPLGRSDSFSGYVAINNLFVNSDVNDVSIVQAGRDILYSSFTVAGPGTLDITAGRNILMEGKASVTSIGAVIAGDKRPGANIALQAGAGEAGADYTALIARYLNPANLARSGMPLADQPGKVVKTYEQELGDWLGTQYGFRGSASDALAYYAALPAEQQRVFARQVYFAELTAGGREYNDPASPRYGSYLRGRNMIATLFPQNDASGHALTYAGDITLFGDAGVHTLFGGDIQMLTPGGRQVFGVEGSSPAGSAGVITQGSGNVQLYSNGSLLLGQSRIMTTFGGDIIAWSATGDINAGRGSKTSVVYTPPKRVYDNVGNVTLSSDVPSTGAGIATLAPIPEVPAGDIDLIAPLGTIDAGEAGIRVSGNVNIAALQVVNAANIQVQGKSTGLPVVAAVNVGALTNASAAASSAAMAAQDAMARDRATARQNLPSVFTVRVLGFGNEAGPVSDAGGRSGYNSSSPVQVLGQGPIGARQSAQLTDEEKRLLLR